MTKKNVSIFQWSTFILMIAFTWNFPVYSQNYALHFDGVNDYVITPNLYDSFNGTSRTIELWFYAEAEGVILAEQGTTSLDNLWYDSQIEIVGTNVKVSVWDTHANIVSLGTIVYNTWNHVVLRYDHSSRLLDGFLNGVKSTSTNVTIQNSSTGKLYYTIGALSATNLGSGAWFKGIVDEVRFWNDVRSDQEITDNKNHELNWNEANLVAYYKLNETSGTIAHDATANSLNGTLVNLSGSEWVASPLNLANNNALSFDGINDYVETGDVIEGSVAHTEEAWIKWAGDNSTSSVFQDVILKPYITSTAIHNDGSLHANYGDGTSWAAGINSSTKIPVNVWTHIATVRESSGRVRLFINGIEDKNSTTIILSGTNSAPRCIGVGKYNPINNYWFNGELDEVRIWNTSRSASEIRENMMRTLVGNESGLAAYYRFDQAAGSTLYGATSNAYNGTLTNMDATTDWVDSESFTTWLGTIGSDWATASNWSDGVPTSTDNVGIYKWNTGSELSITGTANANNMVISTTARPTLTGELTIGGKLIVTGNGKITKSATGKLTATKDLILENNANGAIKIE